MKIQDIKTLYAATGQCAALSAALSDGRSRSLYLRGLHASAAPVVFSALAERSPLTAVFILQDADEAGYFYHDLTQLMGQERVLFYPPPTAVP